MCNNLLREYFFRINMEELAYSVLGLLLEMNKRTKLKIKNMQMFMTKYVFNSKYIVRNLLAATLLITFVGVIAGVIMMIDVNKEEPEEVAESTAQEMTLYTYQSASMDVESISKLKTSIEASNETGVEANEPQMVSESTGEFDSRFVAIESNVNVRAEATTESDIVGTLNTGDVGDIISSDGEWLNIKSGDVTGYVKAEFVLTGDDAYNYAADYKIVKGVVTESGVFIREEASTESEVIGSANAGDTFDVDSATTATVEGWVCVYLSDDVKGYISADYVSLEEGYSTATTVEQESDEETSEDDSTEEPEETTTEAPVETPTTEAPVVETPAEEPKQPAEETDSNEVSVETTYRDAVSLSAEDINLMAAVIYLESGSESYEGQLAVANVIITRLKSGAYGSTISDVVYAPYQFTVVSSPEMEGLIANGAPASCVQAATEAAAGKNNVGNYMCFKPSWNVNTSSLSSYTIIGNHVFY